MKKFSLLMAAALVGLSASAADLYLRGDMNGWGSGAEWKFSTEDNETYTLANKAIVGGQKWKIADANWGTNNWGGSAGIQLDTPVTLINGSNNNCSLAESCPSATFTFNTTTGVLTVTGEAGDVVVEYDYGLRGNCFEGGTDWTNEHMTLKDGLYVLENKTVAGGSFGVILFNKGTEEQGGWWNSADGAVVTLDTPMQLVPDGEGGVNMTIAAGTYTFTLDVDAKTLTVTGEQGGDDPIPPTPGDGMVIYFDNTANWATPYIHYWGGATSSSWPGVAMSKVEGEENIWSYTVPAGTTGILFNAGDGDATKTSDMVPVADHVYTTAGDSGKTLEEYVQGGDDPIPPTPGDEYVVYFDNKDTNWDNVYAYAWKGETNNTWPGVQMEVYDGTIYKVVFTEEYTSIVFNNGMSGADEKKTADLELVADAVFTINGNQGNIEDYNPENPPVIDYDTWWINCPGDFNEWGDNGVQPVNGVATLEKLNIGTGAFKIKAWTGTEAIWYGSNGPIAVGEAVALSEGGGDITISGASDTVLYDVTFEVATATIKVTETSTGVASVAAENGEAIFFNLQGQRVANPENGLFIRVQNGKAVKVIK